MADNFFLDNQDLQFYLDKIDLEEIVKIKEHDYSNVGEYPTAPRHYQDAKDNYRLLLEVLGDVSANVMLQSGDVVYIPPMKKLHTDESMVYVGGEVKKPDFYEFQPGMTAFNACIMAGGFARFAAPNRTKIIRKENGRDVTIEINLKKVMSGKISDVELKPGDRVHVPETWL